MTLNFFRDEKYKIVYCHKLSDAWLGEELMLKWLKRSLLLVLVVLLAAAAIVWYLINGSLAKLDGEIAIMNLSAPVQIERDALGTVTIHAENEYDMAQALGYIHAQERFFEMDLLRRSAAGELSELFGDKALEKDKSARVHRLRARVEANMAAFAGDKLDIVNAYTQGVNKGLKDLRVKPWPYLLLQTTPKPWTATDSAMVGYAMFFDLQDESNSRELALWKIKQSVPDALYQLLAADGTEWDAPLMGEPRGNVALPSADVLDLRKLPAPAAGMNYGDTEPAAPGSNNFAVAGPLTKDGRAIVADDMHLGLRAPNIWFRARLLYKDANKNSVDVSGFTLPGIPAVIVGSNTHVAWGFTNSYGDWLDWYVVHPEDSIKIYKEKILVKGAAPVEFEIRESNGRPIMVKDVNGNELALQWVAHTPGSLSTKIFSLANVKNNQEALSLFQQSGMPHQNAVFGDSSGKIAWKLTGLQKYWAPDCRRTVPLDDNSPKDDKDPNDIACFTAPLTPDYLHPQIVSPDSNRLWSANARVTDGEMLRQIGDAGYANGARAKQIRDDLFAKQQFTEKDLLAIQLDDRTLFLQRWWQQLRKLSENKNDPMFQEIREATGQWDARATTDAKGYRLVRAWRLAVIDRIKDGLTAPAQAKLGKDFAMPDLPQIEGVSWQLITQQPEHLLPHKFTSWDALLSDAAKEVYGQLKANGPLKDRIWGEKNTAAICHPIARALPAFSKRWLCMPADQLNGDMNMPRVQSPDFGASERMVVSPGRETDGIIHMPGGQSGHPMSPFWGAGHSAWVKGEATPFLPGKTVHKLEARAPHY
jgi:penicillin G amidase